VLGASYFGQCRCCDVCGSLCDDRVSPTVVVLDSSLRLYSAAPVRVVTGQRHSRVLDLNVVFVTLSSVIIQLPGFGISIAIRELISDHIVAGISRLVTNFVLLLWLVGTSWLIGSLRISFVGSITGTREG
jgi:hypothetical protein